MIYNLFCNFFRHASFIDVRNSWPQLANISWQVVNTNINVTHACLLAIHARNSKICFANRFKSTMNLELLKK